MVVVFCQECEQATGTGYFAGKPAHDRHVQSPWNTHQLTEYPDTDDKARWMLKCPRCLDDAAEGTPEAGFTTKHPTVCVDENGDEIIKCSSCGKLYHFNAAWVFGTKALPPTSKWGHDKLYLVRPNQDGEEFELYRDEQSANERVMEIYDDELETDGYKKIDDDEWESPFGKRLSRGEALEELESVVGADLPADPQEVDVL